MDSFRQFIIRGKSMQPFLYQGDVLGLLSPASEDIRIGNVIVYKNNLDHWVCHRVVAIRDQTDRKLFKTRGDSVPHSDLMISSDRVIGKVIGKYIQGRLVPITRFQELFFRYYAVVYRRIRWSIIRRFGVLIKSIFRFVSHSRYFPVKQISVRNQKITVLFGMVLSRKIGSSD